MMMGNSREASSERGSAMYELAFVGIITFTLIFAIMDFSHAMYAYHFVSNAAREATRYASVRGSTFSSTPCAFPSVVYACETNLADIEAYVKSTIPSGISVSSVSSSTTIPCPTSSTVGQVYVCAKWGGVPTGAAGTCPSNPGGGENPGCLVEVQVQYVYGFTLPLVSKDVGSISMTSTSEMTIEQ
jgi:Flp pilus assembly protein TadG